MSKADLYDILSEMIEQAGVITIIEEIVAGMSSDELQATVGHLDQHLFANHYLHPENDIPTSQSGD